MAPPLPSAEPSLSGWGRVPLPGRELLGEDLARLTLGAALSRGLGRSYGDSSLPAIPSDKVVGTRLANRLLSFDPSSGRLRAEAGTSLAEINRIFIPRGWFSPVTPGTKFVTLGGMVASDVHGKNHHVAGCFGEHVAELRLRLADDSIVTASPATETELFDASIGGMGLLGHLLEVEFKLERIPSGWIKMHSERVGSVKEFVQALSAAAPRFPMTMGWIDCLTQGASMGRGILMAGRWATAEEAPGPVPRPRRELTFPLELPNFALNPLTAKAFNFAYYHRHFARSLERFATPDAFFYPLDSIRNWNRVYGPRGFTQYQCVLPRAAGHEAVVEFMQRLTKVGAASPLCVIKDCGAEGRGVLSFPMPGMSVAVDMAVTSETPRIVAQLNEFVIAAGGRIYLTKDSFTRAEHFKAMEPRLERFAALRKKYDPEGRLRSAQSVRVLGDNALGENR